MGLTVVQKSNINERKRDAKIALVLAGGVVTGGAYKIGGLKALNDFLINRKIVDFDTYIGLSAGSIIAAPLAGGIPIEEIFRSLTGTSKYFTQLSPLDFYHPNWNEWFGNPMRLIYDLTTFFPDVFLGLLASIPMLRDEIKSTSLRFLKRPSVSNLEKLLRPIMKTILSSREIPSLLDYLPSGIFNNSRLELYIRKNMAGNGLSNSFQDLYERRGKELYIMAMDLDTSERVVFGHDRNNNFTISEAIQASTALPVFYKPAHLHGRDYVDGAVRKTANLDVAIESGAELIICYNPFRPIYNRLEKRYDEENGKIALGGKRIASGGVISVVNQVFRTLLHTRLMIAISKFQRDPNFKGDIILIEPQEHDYKFFSMNPANIWERTRAAHHGYRSVTEIIENNYFGLKRLLASYGIKMTRAVTEEGSIRIRESGYSEEAIIEALATESPRREAA